MLTSVGVTSLDLAWGHCSSSSETTFNIVVINEKKTLKHYTPQQGVYHNILYIKNEINDAILMAKSSLFVRHVWYDESRLIDDK